VEEAEAQEVAEDLPCLLRADVDARAVDAGQDTGTQTTPKLSERAM